jgi:hypothetical protein
MFGHLGESPDPDVPVIRPSRAELFADIHMPPPPADVPAEEEDPENPIYVSMQDIDRMMQKLQAERQLQDPRLAQVLPSLADASRAAAAAPPSPLRDTAAVHAAFLQGQTLQAQMLHAQTLQAQMLQAQMLHAQTGTFSGAPPNMPPGISAINKIMSLAALFMTDRTQTRQRSVGPYWLRPANLFFL